jgi:hypothetical protein
MESTGAHLSAGGDLLSPAECKALFGATHIDAANVAQRLIAAGRPAESLEWLDKERRACGPFDLSIADLRIVAMQCNPALM